MGLLPVCDMSCACAITREIGVEGWAFGLHGPCPPLVFFMVVSAISTDLLRCPRGAPLYAPAMGTTIRSLAHAGVMHHSCANYSGESHA